ncbi:MAG: hypothetical protein HRU08_13140 [Oleispira sp.]|nr:hypothetical protein [Oleispira sp.]
MRKFLLLAISQLLFISTVNASTYIWSSAIPTQVHIVPEGLLLIGDFENAGVNCAGAITQAAILLPKSDPGFEHKLSLALTANAAGKTIETLVYTEASSDCIQISASGYVPKAHYYYWRLKN